MFHLLTRWTHAHSVAAGAIGAIVIADRGDLAAVAFAIGAAAGVAAVLVALGVHRLARAWRQRRRGEATPQRVGRMTAFEVEAMRDRLLALALTADDRTLRRVRDAARTAMPNPAPADTAEMLP